MAVTLARHAIVPILMGAALAAPASERELRNSIALGALAFADNCQKCHRIDGYGEEALYPSLHNAELLADKARLIRTLLHGRTVKNDAGCEKETRMPALDFLTNREVAAIIAFISNSWGDEVLVVSEKEVGDARQALRGAPAQPD